jgi:hypothetical protein
LAETEFGPQILVKVSNIKYHENPIRWDTEFNADRQTDKKKLICAFISRYNTGICLDRLRKTTIDLSDKMSRI